MNEHATTTATPPESPAPSSRPRRPWAGGRPAWVVIALATVALFAISVAFQPDSVRSSVLQGMLPFAAVLAIAAMGQTLVIQQRGIDLSVPGIMSLVVVLVTHGPNGDGGKLFTAILLAFAVAAATGLLSGLLITRLGITPIVTTLGVNALLLGAIVQISKGSPTTTTEALHGFANGHVLGIPTTIVIAALVMLGVSFVIKRTTVGRRYEAVGASAAAARAAGIDPLRYQLAAYVGASVLYCCAAILLAGVVTTPSITSGDTYLLPTVAAVVLGGTSLLGGVGSVAATAVAALFLTQLDQFVLATGASSAVQNLVQAVALAVGIGVYSVNWPAVAARLGALGDRGRGATAAGSG
ncbi:Ribose ABC transport system permease protein RbsC (TC 3.A.1.2.1) [Patulibacter medicamentivorans]|jgi:ribose transport system permease protein|uniref:Autoinducer 2 import system permease protein LsrC n=1 Tax=Patulibacter medicamentivorans TaxID=1097667 RepID=H0E6H3_9ACTN|nr:ABC transporter permease [Patulibacter medicamentivorans]EHN10714.1 Ribose ABC transport system permease protein RbsC (TC 3.A.1.2.1) [Patulibacter medicamentivorans]